MEGDELVVFDDVCSRFAPDPGIALARRRARVIAPHYTEEDSTTGEGGLSGMRNLLRLPQGRTNLSARPAVSARAATRILARVPLPDALVDAIGAVLDREAAEQDFRVRAELLAAMRAAIGAWLDGVMTERQTVTVLYSLCAPRLEGSAA